MGCDCQQCRCQCQMSNVNCHRHCKDDAAWAVELAAQASAYRAEQKAKRAKSVAAMDALKVHDCEFCITAMGHSGCTSARAHQESDRGAHETIGVSKIMSWASCRPSGRSSCWNNVMHVRLLRPTAHRRRLPPLPRPPPTCSTRWRCSIGCIASYGLMWSTVDRE